MNVVSDMAAALDNMWWTSNTNKGSTSGVASRSVSSITQPGL